MNAVDFFQLIFGHFQTYSFGFFVLISFFLFLVTLHFEIQRRKLSDKHIFDVVFWALFFALFFGRFTYVLFHLDYYSERFVEIFQYWYGGFYFNGALIGAFLYICFWLFKKHNKSLYKWLDAFIISALPALSVLKIGFYFLYLGNPSFDFSFFSLSPYSLPLFHLIESGVYILVYLLLLFFYRSQKTSGFSGVVFYILLMLMSFVHWVFTPEVVSDFGVSFFGYLVGPSQLFSILVLTVGLVGLIIRVRGIYSKEQR